MALYEVEPWSEFFVMVGGASAALAGLLFVAVSLNLEHVLRYRRLPALASQSVAVLIALVVLSACGLAPQRSTTAFGAEVLAIGLVLALLVVVPAARGIGTTELLRWRVANIVLAAVVVTPMLAAGISLLVRAGGGMIWLLAEVVAGIAVAAYDAWILLIEIRR